MSVACYSCKKDVTPDVNGLCPQCGQPAASPHEATMAGIFGSENAHDAPAPSSMFPQDAALLQGGQMHPPSRLGSLGRIGKFEIVKRLGQGGMGDVMLGIEPITGAYVAIKTLRPDMTHDPRIAKCFLSEARHMYELSHPHILKVMEVSNEQDGVFFVMPFMAQGSIDRKIGPGGMPPAEVVRIAIQVAEGLSYAHSKGLIHRDLKPANILLDDENRVAISDFGLVRPFFNDSLLEGKPKHPVGTPAYMSPSIAAGAAEDTRADIYAFGATLYEMLSGHPPYPGHDPMRIIQSIIDGPPAPLATAKPGTPAPLVAVVEWCMARELRDRYASMTDVLEDLRRIEANQPPRGPHGSGHPTRPSTRRLATLATVVVLLTVVVIGSIMVANRLRTASPSTQSAALTSTHPRAREVQMLYEAAMHDMEAGRLRDGTDKLRAAFEVDPGNSAVAIPLVTQLIRVGHYDPARGTLSKWLRADPGNPEALRLQAQLEQTASANNPAPTPRPAPPERTGENRVPPRGPQPPRPEGSPY